MTELFSDARVAEDGKGGYILYTDQSCQEVIGFFPEKEDAEICRRAFASVGHPAPEALPRCPRMNGTSLRVVPAYTEAGRFQEANAVTITDGERTAVYVPAGVVSTTCCDIGCGRPATYEIVGEDPLMSTFACDSHADRLTGDGETAFPMDPGEKEAGRNDDGADREAGGAGSDA